MREPNSVSRWILLAASLAAVLPVWIAPYPPMTDLPQHAAQIALLHQLRNPPFAYAGMFRINWFTPYLFGYLLIYVLTPLFGIAASCKLAISFFLAGFPLATGLLISSVELDPFWAILSIPCAYGFAYQWGLLNFLIAAPFGICFLWFVMRGSQRFSLFAAIGFAISAIVLFFCHALICALFGLCAVLYILGTQQSLKAATLRLLPLSAVVPIALLWLHKARANSSAQDPIFGDWNWLTTEEQYYQSLSQELHFHLPYWGRLPGFTSNLLGLFPSWFHLAIAVTLFALPLCAGYRIHDRWVRRLPIVLCLAILLFCPSKVLGTDYIYQRFTMFAVPLYLLALRPPSGFTTRSVAIKSAAILMVAGLVTAAVARAVTFRREAQGFQDALALMVPGQRALSLVFDHGDGVSIAPTFLHFPCWYTAEGHGLVDPSAAVFLPELVLYRPGAAPQAVLVDFEWDPSEFNWQEYSAGQYRYFIVRSQEDLTATLFSSVPCPVDLLLHQEKWWLYQRGAACP